MKWFPRKAPEIAWSGRPSVACLLIAIFLFFSPAAVAEGRKPKEFVEGIRAFDTGEWPESAEFMTEALKKQPEDGELVRLYGTRFEPYLPQFYRGVAFYKLDKCDLAVEAWTASVSAGAVQKTKKYEVLLQYLAECQRRLSGVTPVPLKPDPP